MKKKKSSLREFLDLLLIFVTTCCVFIGIRYMIRFPTVNGSSMEPTYHDGDKLIVFYTKNVSENDIVVSWSKPLNEYIVKRVIGVPGDKIEIKDGTLYRNGFLLYESYVKDKDWYSEYELSLTVGNDEYFLLGDNRNHSTDSRELGTVSKNDIFGKVIGYLPKKTREMNNKVLF